MNIKVKYKKTKTDVHPRKCAWCGKMFLSFDVRRKTCRGECAQRYCYYHSIEENRKRTAKNMMSYRHKKARPEFEKKAEKIFDLLGVTPEQGVKEELLDLLQMEFHIRHRDVD